MSRYRGFCGGDGEIALGRVLVVVVVVVCCRVGLGGAG